MEHVFRIVLPFDLFQAIQIGAVRRGHPPAHPAAQRGPQGAAVARLLPHVRDIRRHGAASLDLCWVACGRLDAYYERWLGGLWDLRAGELIVREAGGRTSAIEGGPPVPPSVLAATPALLEPLRVLLNSE